jgi:hypothetical protein
MNREDAIAFAQRRGCARAKRDSVLEREGEEKKKIGKLIAGRE